jgi:hypothetical protein
VVRGFCNVKMYGGIGAFSYFTKDSLGGWDGLGAGFAVTDLLTCLVREGVGPPRSALGYTLSTGAAPFSGATVLPAYFDGSPAAVSESHFETVFNEDFHGSDVVVPFVAGTGQIARYAAPWWMNASDPSTVQGVDGRAGMASDGSNPGHSYLIVNNNAGGVPAPALVIDPTLDLILRMTFARRAAVAGTIRIGVMDTFTMSDPANGLFVRQVNDGGNILFVARKSNVETVLDSGLGVTAALGMVSVEMRLRSFIGAPLTLDAYIVSPKNAATDGYVGTAPATNLPTTPLGVGASMSATTGNLGWIIDRFNYAARRGSA